MKQTCPVAAFGAMTNLYTSPSLIDDSIDYRSRQPVERPKAFINAQPENTLVRRRLRAIWKNVWQLRELRYFDRP